MGNRYRPPPDEEIYEPFAVQEFFVSHVGKTEIVEGTDCMRFYLGTMRNGHFHLEFTTVVPIARVATLARQSTEAAAEHHNSLTFAHLDGDGVEH